VLRGIAVRSRLATSGGQTLESTVRPTVIGMSAGCHVSGRAASAVHSIQWRSRRAGTQRDSTSGVRAGVVVPRRAVGEVWPRGRIRGDSPSPGRRGGRGTTRRHRARQRNRASAPACDRGAACPAGQQARPKIVAQLAGAHPRAAASEGARYAASGVRRWAHSGPKGSLLPATNLRSAPDLSILTVRMTPPDEPSRAMAWLSALTTNSSHCAAVMPGLKYASQKP